MFIKDEEFFIKDEKRDDIVITPFIYSIFDL